MDELEKKQLAIAREIVEHGDCRGVYCDKVDDIECPFYNYDEAWDQCSNLSFSRGKAYIKKHFRDNSKKALHTDYRRIINEIICLINSGCGNKDHKEGRRQIGEAIAMLRELEHTDDWLPVETAPTDGSQVLVAVKNEKYARIAWYSEKTGLWPEKEEFTVCGEPCNVGFVIGWKPLPETGHIVPAE